MLFATGLCLVIVLVTAWLINSRTPPYPKEIWDAIQNGVVIVNDPAWRHFQSWLTAEGVTNFEHLQLAKFPDYGRGILLLKDLHESDIILELPKHVALNSETQRRENTLLMTALKDPNYVLDDALLLTLVLIGEKQAGNRSFWKPYIDILPQRYPELVPYWTDAELSLVDGSVRRLVEWKQHQLKAACSVALDLSRRRPEALRHWVYNEDDVRWALCAVTSRFWGTPEQGWGGVTMLPLMDLINHAADATACQFKETAIAVAPANMTAGCQLFVRYYGHKMQHSDAVGFVAFGFLFYLTDGMPRVPIQADLHALLQSDNQTLREAQLAALGSLRCSDEQTSLVTNASAGVPENFLRCIVAARATSLEDVQDAIDNHIPLRRRDDALRIVRTNIVAQLAAFRTTIAMDDEALQDPILSPTARNLITLRRMEKAVLQRLASLVDEELDTLSNHLR